MRLSIAPGGVFAIISTVINVRVLPSHTIDGRGKGWSEGLGVGVGRFGEHEGLVGVTGSEHTPSQSVDHFYLLRSHRSLFSTVLIN